MSGKQHAFILLLIILPQVCLKAKNIPCSMKDDISSLRQMLDTHFPTHTEGIQQHNEGSAKGQKTPFTEQQSQTTHGKRPKGSIG